MWGLFFFFSSFAAYYLFIFSFKIAKTFNSYQTRESACTLHVFILAQFPLVVLVQVAVDFIPCLYLVFYTALEIFKKV